MIKKKNDTINNWFESKRQAVGKNKKEFAEQFLKITPSSYNHILCGRQRPAFDTLVEVSKVFPVAELFDLVKNG